MLTQARVDEITHRVIVWNFLEWKRNSEDWNLIGLLRWRDDAPRYAGYRYRPEDTEEMLLVACLEMGITIDELNQWYSMVDELDKHGSDYFMGCLHVNGKRYSQFDELNKRSSLT